MGAETHSHNTLYYYYHHHWVYANIGIRGLQLHVNAFQSGASFEALPTHPHHRHRHSLHSHHSGCILCLFAQAVVSITFLFIYWKVFRFICGRFIGRACWRAPVCVNSVMVVFALLFNFNPCLLRLRRSLGFSVNLFPNKNISRDAHRKQPNLASYLRAHLSLVCWAAGLCFPFVICPFRWLFFCSLA